MPGISNFKYYKYLFWLTTEITHVDNQYSHKFIEICIIFLIGILASILQCHMKNSQFMFHWTMESGEKITNWDVCFDVWWWNSNEVKKVHATEPIFDEAIIINQTLLTIELLTKFSPRWYRIDCTLHCEFIFVIDFAAGGFHSFFFIFVSRFNSRSFYMLNFNQNFNIP